LIHCSRCRINWTRDGMLLLFWLVLVTELFQWTCRIREEALYYMFEMPPTAFQHNSKINCSFICTCSTLLWLCEVLPFPCCFIPPPPPAWLCTYCVRLLYSLMSLCC
jgi:hypothetical protein